MMWLTASLADGQSPELAGKEHKQGLWWAAVTQNLPAEEQRGERGNNTGTFPWSLSLHGTWASVRDAMGLPGAPGKQLSHKKLPEPTFKESFCSSLLRR